MRVWNSMAFLAVAAVSTTFLSATVMGQSPAASSAAAGTRIAVIDVGYVVKNHPNIKQQQTQIRNLIKAAQDEMIKRREALVKEAEKLKEFKEGSPEFNKLQEQLLREETQLKLDMSRKEKEFDEVEAKMAIDFYKQLQTLITRMAEHYQIDLVLRSNREEPDLKQPATIQMALEKGVVYSKPTLDMTDAVLQMIKEQSPAAPTAPGATGVPQVASPGTPNRNLK